MKRTIFAFFLTGALFFLVLTKCVKEKTTLPPVVTITKTDATEGFIQGGKIYYTIKVTSDGDLATFEVSPSTTQLDLSSSGVNTSGIVEKPYITNTPFKPGQQTAEFQYMLAITNLTPKDTKAQLTFKVTNAGGIGKVTTEEFTVKEGKSNITFSVSPENVAALNATGASSTTFTISSNINWKVESNTDWITFDKSTGSGEGKAIASFKDNATTLSRSGIITITGTSTISGTVLTGYKKEIAITQNGVPAALDIDVNTTKSITYEKGTFEIKVTSNVDWTAASDHTEWITISPASGKASAQPSIVTLTYNLNSSSTDRIAKISFKGTGINEKIVTITQTGLIFGVSPEVVSAFNATGASPTTFTIASNINWKVESNATWITFDKSNGSGEGKVIATYADNTTTQNRSGIITITGTTTLSGTALSGFKKEIAITQNAATPSFEIDVNATKTVTSDKGTFDIKVTSNVDWTATSDHSEWITISPVSGKASTLPATVTVTYSLNATINDRTAKISFKGSGITEKTVSVTQTGAAPTLNVDVISKTIGALGESFAINVTSNTTWEVTSDQTWCKLDVSASVSGDKTIVVTLPENKTISALTANITFKANNVAGKTVKVIQLGATAKMDIDQTLKAFGAAGGDVIVNVTSNISWSATSTDNSWCTLSGSSGSGDGKITIKVAANTITSPRTTKVTVAGGSFTKEISITQEAAAVILMANTSSLAALATGGTVNFTITSNNDWTITKGTTDSWYTLSTTQGKDNKQIDVQVTANTKTTTNNGTITIKSGDKTLQIDIQQAAAGVDLRLIPDISNNVETAGKTILVDIISNVPWIATNNSSDLCTILNNLSGLGNYTLQIQMKANTLAKTQSATIIVSGGGISRTITINQLAAAASVIVSQSAITVESVGKSVTAEITANTAWSASSNKEEWCTIAPKTGNSGTQTLTIVCAPNTTIDSRTATITVTGGLTPQTITVNQTKGLPTLTVSQTALSFDPAISLKAVDIQSNTTWKAVSDQPWCSLSTNLGNGNKTINVTCTENTFAEQRTATITISATDVSNKTIIVTQNEASPTLTVTELNQNVQGTAGTTSFKVTSNAKWTVLKVASDTWITSLTESGSGNGTINVDYLENPIPSIRIATLTITGGGITKTFTVTQAAAFITITTPVSWVVNSNQSIKWTTNLSGNIKIELIKGTSVVQIISSSLSANMLFTDWSIPIKSTITNDYKLRITHLTNGVVSESNVFAITNTTSTTVTDLDGNVYNTVNIGTQNWMRENLKVSQYSNGDVIPNVTASTMWPILTTGAYCSYENNVGYMSTYGALYNWYTVADNRNACPTGWHVPSSAEWTVLINFLGGASVAGGKMKETGYDHWQSPNTGATNLSGFTALPGGFRYRSSKKRGEALPPPEFNYLTGLGRFWSSSYSGTTATDFSISAGYDYKGNEVQQSTSDFFMGYSVRCLQNK